MEARKIYNASDLDAMRNTWRFLDAGERLELYKELGPVVESFFKDQFKNIRSWTEYEGERVFWIETPFAEFPMNERRLKERIAETLEEQKREDIKTAAAYGVQLDIYLDGTSAASADDFSLWCSDYTGLYQGWLLKDSKVFADFCAADSEKLEEWLKLLGLVVMW